MLVSFLQFDKIQCLYDNKVNLREIKMQDNISKQQRHEIWLKNSGFLYDRLMIEKLTWPSLTFQWLPTKIESKDRVIYEFMYATHTSGEQQVESLHIAQVIFPKLKQIYEQGQEAMPSSVIKQVQTFTHQIQINKARYYQQDPSFIAAKSDDAPIAIFKRGTQFPVLLLGNPQQKGFALQWKQYGLLTGDLEGVISIWKDIQKQPTIIKWKDKVEDTKWIDCNSFCSVGDDGNMCMWDLRTGKVDQVINVGDDGKEIYTVAINHKNVNLILTGGQDTTIKLWDRRILKRKLHCFAGHDDSVTNLQWSPVNPTMFASGSPDHKVKIWDLMRVGFQVPRQNTGFDQLVFTHEGHLGQVTDIGWNHHEMILGSTQQDQNTIQFYQITNNIQDLQYIQDLDYLQRQCFQ